MERTDSRTSTSYGKSRRIYHRTRRLSCYRTLVCITSPRREHKQCHQELGHNNLRPREPLHFRKKRYQCIMRRGGRRRPAYQRLSAEYRTNPAEHSQQRPSGKSNVVAIIIHRREMGSDRKHYMLQTLFPDRGTHRAAENFQEIL